MLGLGRSTAATSCSTWCMNGMGWPAGTQRSQSRPARMPQAACGSMPHAQRNLPNDQTCPSARLVVAADSEVAPAPRSGGGIASPGGCTSNTALTRGPTSSDSMLVSTCEGGGGGRRGSVRGMERRQQERRRRRETCRRGQRRRTVPDLTSSRSSRWLAMAAKGPRLASRTEAHRLADWGGLAALQSN